MTLAPTVHETLTFERSFECPLRILWNAFSDAAARAQWGAPSPTAVILYDEEDFRVGGRDISRCGSRDDPRYRVEAAYLDIQPERRIVYSERVDDGARPLSAALHTVEFCQAGPQSSVKITVQIASYDGPGMVLGVRQGMSAALDNLMALAGRQGAFEVAAPTAEAR